MSCVILNVWMLRLHGLNSSYFMVSGGEAHLTLRYIMAGGITRTNFDEFKR